MIKESALCALSKKQHQVEFVDREKVCDSNSILHVFSGLWLYEYMRKGYTAYNF